VNGDTGNRLTEGQAIRKPWRSYAAKAALIFFAAMFVYIPAMQSKWIWDDNLLITDYALMQHKDGLWVFWFPWMGQWFPSLEKYLPWIATCKRFGDTVPDYYPITWSTLWLEWKIWGNYPQAFHVTNCLMHALAAVLVWRVLVKLSIPGAFLAGLIFAVHPVNVCSVAWVSERKNVLSIIFFLLTLLFYFDFDKTRRVGKYVLALVMFLLALLSKVSVVALPVVLLLAAWWRRGRGEVSPPGFTDHLVGTWQWGSGGMPEVNKAAGRWRYILADVLRTAPFFILGLAASWLIVHSQIHNVIRGESIYKPGEGTIWWRLAMAGAAPWFYVYKALLPLNLLMIYPRWHINTGNVLWYLPGLALVGAAVALLWLHRRAWARHLIFALGYFLVLLLPVLGFFDMYFMVHSLVADHWQYLSIIAVIALVVGTGTWLFNRYDKTVRWAGVGVAAAVVSVLAVLTWTQTLVYDDQIALWSYNLPKNPDAWMGQYNMGTTLAEQAVNQTDSEKTKAMLNEALGYLVKATELNPTDDAACNNTGLTLMNLGRLDESLVYLHRAVDVARGGMNPQAAINLSLVYRRKDNFEEALKWITRAEEMQRVPDILLIHGQTLLAANRPQEAVEEFSKLLEMAPKHVQGLYERGVVYRLLGQPDKAKQDFLTALSIQENAAPAMLQLALLAQEQGQRDEAIDWCTKAVLVQAGYAEARYKLGVLLLEAGRPREAAAQLKTVLYSDPNSAEAHSNLAVALYQLGLIGDSIAEYRRALAIHQDWVGPMSDLARILSHPRTGPYRDIPAAMELAERACRLSNYADPAAVETLAMVYGEAGRFAEAIRMERRLLEIVTPSGDERAVKLINARIRHYETGRPLSVGFTFP